MFAERLKTSLSLTIAGTTHEIAGGNIKHVELDLASHGFTARVEFWLPEDQDHGGQRTDALLEAFLGAELIEATLRVAPFPHDATKASEVEPIELTGLVRAKSLVEATHERSRDLPVFLRCYRVELADPAQVLWTQHFPCELYIDATMKSVIEAHAGEAITLALDWDVLTTQKPMLFLGLEERHRASFYDFVLWYCDSQGGAWWYDYAGASYQIAAAKAEPGEAVEILGDDVASVEVAMSEVPRYQYVVLNSYAESPRNAPVEQAQAVTGVRRDVLLRTPIAQVVDDRVTLESKRVRVPVPEVAMRLGALPLSSLVPGAALSFPATMRWSSKSALVGKTWRVWRLRLEARSRDPLPEDYMDMDHASYDVVLDLSLEQTTDERVRLPGFRAPCYPAHVEGKIVSEQGEDADLTYQNYQNADTSLDEYKVAVPLWESKQITVPFEPYHASGKVYIPAFKGQRVLLAMHLEAAHIERFLVWRDDTPLSMDVQGEHIRFGKSATSHTAMQHAYEEEKPVFQIARLNDKDTASIKISEGVLFIEVKENQS
jgi:hypothetical protein